MAEYTIRQRLVAAGFDDSQVSNIKRSGAGTPHDPLNLLCDHASLLITDSGKLFVHMGGLAVMSFSLVHSAYKLYLVVGDDQYLRLTLEWVGFIDPGVGR